MAGDALRRSSTFRLLSEQVDAARRGPGMYLLSRKGRACFAGDGLGYGHSHTPADIKMGAARPPLARPACTVLQMRAQLADAARPVRLVAGHNLYEEGDDAGSFFVLQEGAAAVAAGSCRARWARVGGRGAVPGTGRLCKMAST